MSLALLGIQRISGRVARFADHALVSGVDVLWRSAIYWSTDYPPVY